MGTKLYDNKQLNKLIVVNKPIFRSSNSYLNQIKKKYRNKKAGFSGTLDPFACGCLVVAFGQYSKLFNYFDKSMKTYRAVIWLGVKSSSLDMENIIKIEDSKKLDEDILKKEIESLIKEHEYYPPKFCAKKINGKRAYELARQGKQIQMKKSLMKVYDTKFICYKHPFISFEVSLSEGSYVRSLAQILLKKVNRIGTLSYLNRLNEGKFKYEDEKDLNPLDFLSLDYNTYSGDKSYFENGKKISIDYFKNKKDGEYIVKFDEFFSIIKIEQKKIKYLLNKILL